MDVKIVQRFIQSAQKVLAQEMGGPVQVGKPYADGSHYLSRGVTTLVGVNGHLQGMIILGLSEETALAVVSTMMGEPYPDFDDVAKSGISELGNVVVGSGVTSVAEMGYVCNITPPAVVTGANTAISTPNIPRLVVPLETPAGIVEIQLALKDNGVH